MARFRQITQGTRARKAFPFVASTASGAESIEVDVRPLTSAEEVDALAQARAYAAQRGLMEPKEGQPVYALAVMAFVVLLATLDHESTPDKPVPFFDTVDQVLSLDRDRLQLLYEAQVAWQEECSPRTTTLTPEEYAGLVYALATEEVGDAAGPFVARLPRATLVNCARTMARQLLSSPPPRSPSSSSTSASGASEDAGASDDAERP